ncbi:lactadherin-like [Nematostella vectensis]|uniref:lactadherin-like n=1 Tax=Nematostella vectensis TaxID=45351 RepID=UPI002077938A|nr:lactadherin-like [Nematostella vectensis]
MKLIPHLCLAILLSWQHAIAQDCRDYIYFMPGTQLLYNVIETKQTTKYECRESCSETPQCVSINYKQKESRCELNSASHMTHPGMLRPEVGAFYALVKPPTSCSDNYCSTGKRCVMTGKGVAYRCEVCKDALGMESGEISNSAITASSYYLQGINKYSMPYYARLNNVGQIGVSNGAWLANNYVAGEYLEIDIGRNVAVDGVAAQGGPGATYRVTSYKISYKTDLTAWFVVKEDGQEKVALSICIP